jgi:hypothetical protein
MQTHNDRYFSSLFVSSPIVLFEFVRRCDSHGFSSACCILAEDIVLSEDIICNSVPNLPPIEFD